MARGNLNMVPMNAEDIPRVLHELQGSFYFEKTLPASTVANAGKLSGLTLPSWFVEKHGNKFRKSITLRTESSPQLWPVNLTVSCFTPNSTQVRFAGGWHAFAISHGLLRGDTLIFKLTAMSEFNVYVFRSAEGPNENPPPKQRKRTHDSGHSQKKATQPHRKPRDEQMSAADEEGSDESTNSSNRKSSAVYDPSIAPTPPTCEEDKLQHLPRFCKKLTASNVRRGGKAYLEFPGYFYRKHGHRIRTVFKLQGIHEQSPARTMTYDTSFGKSIRHYVRADWRAFVTKNHLLEGQLLLFTLVADSFFVVRDRGAL